MALERAFVFLFVAVALYLVFRGLVALLHPITLVLRAKYVKVVAEANRQAAREHADAVRIQTSEGKVFDDLIDELSSEEESRRNVKNR